MGETCDCGGSCRLVEFSGKGPRRGEDTHFLAWQCGCGKLLDKRVEEGVELSVRPVQLDLKAYERWVEQSCREVVSQARGEEGRKGKPPPGRAGRAFRQRQR